MNRFEQWFVKRIFAKAVIQGGHQERITEIYRLLRDVTEDQFTEDNQPTIDDALRECFESTQFDNQYKG